ncbi:small G protein signaling modulator 2 isoform X5 [Thunnus albacares]|uniref:small G protein signaling modulator 2 isoform X5 n=1 Tax=Thunnus maccoyii TaxID=8240 RepID=UPI001C4D8ABE|nr:small G protein signaling modulator 2 isoform X5 [Thunnus maccoyii]XP_044210032.1 small G protein signaling modulator 2 isoform X5 [Thunnus albacares]
MEGSTEEQYKEKLLWTVKREVKQIMEEAVTKKFVHEDSSHIIALCTAIEACLGHLLKRRAAGFLRSDKIAALFTKVGKVYDTASEVCRKVQEQLQQQADLTRRTQSVGHEPLRRQGSSTTSRPPQPLSAQAIKHIWVRTALFEKVLDKIVQYIVDNSSKYYEREALMHDSVFGPILAALLVGPCALEYTKLKTSDHFWTDPSANELVQRHRIHGAHRGQDASAGRRPALGIHKRQSSGSMSEDRFAASAREYVESLHQNSRTHLLYGKNNVLVQPKKDMEVLRGYLSLHQAGDNLTLKWTPNQLINGTLGDCDLEKSIYWDYALTVPLRQIVCIHCHQRPDCGGTLVLVSQDGIQRPPLHFPPGGHLLAFLSCLETGLLPRGQLEPPLWSQKGKGKVFPKLRKRNSTARLIDQDRNGEEQTAADYVFRIVYPGYRYDAITINYHHTTGSRAPSLDDDEEEEDRLHAMISMICSRNLTDPNVMKDHGEMMEMQGFGSSPSSWQQTEVTTHESLCQSCSMAGSNVSFDYPAGCTCIHDPSDIHTVPLKMLCQNMKRQIVSRAFYGWLAYCRHLSTVRTHLSALVNHNIVPPDRPCEASGGLSKEVWSKYQKDCKNYKELELLRLVYYGGVQHEIRKEVWPFLLGHYKFGMGKKDMSQIDAKISERYQQVMREWKACEVIVKQREKEMQSAIFAKLSSGSSIDSHVLRLVHRDSTLSNEVFMSVDEPDAGSQETPSGEDSTPTMTTMVPSAALPQEERPLVEFDSPDSGLPSSRNYSVTSAHSQILSSIDDGQSTEEEGGIGEEGRTPGVLGGRQDSLTEDRLCSQLDKLVTNGAAAEGVSPSLSSYTIELLDTVALNLHRIDKDVQRCDRNYYYFTTANLEKLRNIMCSYVWEHLEMGYVQGMCDLLAPLMVILDDESLAYSCFTQLMKRMSQNFPNGGAMDTHFANMRSLIQILDSELFELMQQNGDYTHFYFCYRWFLLDFKRELLYEDVFAVWEVIWVAPRISSQHFVLFLALALVTVYREIIMDNNMDFTDIIKFFNEMAERHDVQHILKIARELVHKVQSLMDNK